MALHATQIYNERTMTKAMHSAATLRVWPLLAMTLFGACSDSHDQIGAQSNWLRCEDDAECGALACLCGVCSAPCEAESDCAELDGSAVCASMGDPGLDARCAAHAAPVVDTMCVLTCTDDRDCAGGSASCEHGVCVVSPVAVGSANGAGEAADPGNAGEGDPVGPMEPGAGDSETPIVPTGDDRSACLAPPWTLAMDDPAVTTVACDDPTTVGFELPGDEPATMAEILAFMDSHSTELVELGAVSAFGFGLCCDGGWPADARCMGIGIPLCGMPVSDLAAQLLAWQQENPETAGRSFKVVVELVGRLGPRCPAGECGPVPYQDNDLPEPASRTVIDGFAMDGPACSDDGECFASGCGNECVHWTVDNLGGVCPWVGALSEAFCGCADGRCAWFE